MILTHKGIDGHYDSDEDESDDDTANVSGLQHIQKQNQTPNQMQQQPQQQQQQQQPRQSYGAPTLNNMPFNGLSADSSAYGNVLGTPQQQAQTPADGTKKTHVGDDGEKKVCNLSCHSWDLGGNDRLV